ncbi:Hsp33 family molecular chaperone HslO [Bordetella genomosp. 11]|uniref:Hsp33 family molecular chaperone n=1 Tax=Bordetella genomosp. 11 TaxID=1416808 RepID=A0A261UDN7_9BORD|nr:Hsp33 family molecular chaperone HslO [Bordetella genomosp. 11]OZI59715.1 Hsp33 family molecular chaperone [Bordetella genomosp. 11]
MTDLLKKYLFEDRTVRVQAVRLQDTWRSAQVNHDYPVAIKRLLGELIAASTLLAANLKFDGSLVMQIQGDGPIALLVVECRADLSLRATVKLRQDHAVPDTGTMQSLMNPGGNGRFIVVLDPQRKAPGQQPYQGIVPIVGETIADALSHYMQQSEQLETRLWLAADENQVAGMLLQRMPGQGGMAQTPEAAEETWNRAVQLAQTLKPDELLATDIDTLVHRLYWEETLLTFEPAGVRWHCPCNRGKVADMLRMLGRAEIEDILAERGQVEVACDFCGKPYLFDAVDCAGLFTDSKAVPEQDPPTVH